MNVIKSLVKQRGEDFNKRNKVTFDSGDVVYAFTRKKRLQKPEEIVLNELREHLPDMKMLDIGVGAGRTTSFFANLVKEYVGIDYSKNMIEACRKKFSNHPRYISFLTLDARDLTFFIDNYFDFTLFSWCGIDYVSHLDRIKIFKEIRRVTKAGGYFCFQTHNLNYQRKNCSIQISKNPIQSLWNMVWVIQMRLLNNRKDWKAVRSPSKNISHVIFNDGTHEFRVKSYFNSPTEQLEQLKASGFSETRIFALNGSEIRDLENSTETWLTYFCKVS